MQATEHERSFSMSYSEKYNEYFKQQQQQSSSEGEFQELRVTFPDNSKNSPVGTSSSDAQHNHQTNTMVALTSPVEGWPQLNLAKFEPPAPGTVCYICQGAATSNDLTFFKPCECPYVHRRCFHALRSQTITPKNYFYCSICDHQYKIERVDSNFDPESMEETSIRAQVRLRLALFWFVLIFVLCSSVAIFGFIGYAAERDSKDIPVAMSYVVTSVFRGVPDANTTKLWREDFLDPDTPVFPYYMIFGILITSVAIILAYLIFYVYEECCEHYKEREKSDYREQKASKCSNQCHCSGNDCNYCFYCWWCSSSTSHHEPPCLNLNPMMCDGCMDAACCHCSGERSCVDSCSQSCNCGGSGGGSGGCPDCSNCASGCDCPSCGGDGGCDCGEGAIPFVAAAVLILAIAVVVSAIFIVGYFAAQRIERFHQYYSEMLYKRQLELNNKMVVIGKGESLRPDDQV